jgi:hypothetical protein
VGWEGLEGVGMAWIGAGDVRRAKRGKRGWEGHEATTNNKAEARPFDLYKLAGKNSTSSSWQQIS